MLNTLKSKIESRQDAKPDVDKILGLDQDQLCDQMKSYT